MNGYYNKYLKYKNKYLSLLNQTNKTNIQLGGVDSTRRQYIYSATSDILYKELDTTQYDKTRLDKIMENTYGIVNVPGDGNCFIYSVFVALAYRKGIMGFFQFIVEKYYNLNLEKYSKTFSLYDIFESVTKFENDKSRLLQERIADFFEINKYYFESLANLFKAYMLDTSGGLFKNWVYSGNDFYNNPYFHIDNGAVDGLARNMMCNLLNIKITHKCLKYPNARSEEKIDSNNTRTEANQYQLLYQTLTKRPLNIEGLNDNTIDIIIFSTDTTHYRCILT